MVKRVPDLPVENGYDSDLAERLANYRSRAIREGRKVAVEKIDRAIQEARRPKK